MAWMLRIVTNMWSFDKNVIHSSPEIVKNIQLWKWTKILKKRLLNIKLRANISCQNDSEKLSKTFTVQRICCDAVSAELLAVEMRGRRVFIGGWISIFVL